MKWRKLVPVVVGLLILAAVSSQAATFHVTPAGTGDGLSAGAPANLQAALDAARTNDETDTLLLAAGVYDASTAGANTFEFDAGLAGSDGLPVTITGGWNAAFSAQDDDPALTALDGGGSARVLYVTAGAAAAVADLTLESVTVRNGKTTPSSVPAHGAGVLATQSSGGSVRLSVSRCIFTGNLAEDSVGGAIAAQGPLAVEYTDFSFNRAYSGGAVYLWSTATPATFRRTGFWDNSIRHTTNSPYLGWQGCTLFSTSPDLTIDECEMRGMTDGSLAGAGSPLYLHTGGFVTVRNTAFRNSTNMFWGSAIGLWNAGADIYGCLFANNRAGAPPTYDGYAAVTYFNQNGGASETIRVVNSTFVGNRSAYDQSGDLDFRGGNLTVSNSIFDDTTAYNIMCYDGCAGTIDYSAVERGLPGVQGLTYGAHNTTSVPSFQAGDSDYKLNWDSPLIDAGDKTKFLLDDLPTDFKDAPRVFAVKNREFPQVDMGWDEYVDYTFEITAPAEGTNWLNDGTPKTIAWQCGNIGGDVLIALWKGPREGAVKVQDIAAVPCADQSYAWTVPAALEGLDYAVVVVPEFYSTLERGAAPLSILHLHLKTPNQGKLYQGSPVAITWESSGLAPDTPVLIELYSGGTFVRPIAPAAPNSGSFTWKIPYGQAPGSDYRVRVSATTPTSAEDFSDLPLQVLPAVTLTAPNGGQKIRRGTTYKVTWTYKNKPGAAVRLELYKGGKLNQTIAARTPIGAVGKGSFLWPVPATQAPGTNYTIKVRSATNANCFDFSNRTFTITR